MADHAGCAAADNSGSVWLCEKDKTGAIFTPDIVYFYTFRVGMNVVDLYTDELDLPPPEWKGVWQTLKNLGTLSPTELQELRVERHKRRDRFLARRKRKARADAELDLHAELDRLKRRVRELEREVFKNDPLL
jgi:hypothetical protein